jgi:hypothetical protein
VSFGRRALVVATAVVAWSSGAAFAGSPTPPYSDRLRIVEGLAARFPGQIEKGSPYGRYGLWAGIVVQTEWQLRSHRDRIPLWAVMNGHLTVDPSTFANFYVRSGSPDPSAVCGGLFAVGQCEPWVAYMIASDRHGKPAALQALLWRAHTNSIVQALRTQRRIFDAVHTTALERQFWGGWIEVVFMLEASHFPTDGATAARASRLLMPPCSPLGAPGCGLNVHDLGRSFPFVAALALRHTTIDKALREYTTLRQNPAAVRTIALTDPTLGAALALYLAVAR